MESQCQSPMTSQVFHPYQFVIRKEKIVKKMEKNVEITKFYMIGDNPNSDIKGGNQAGWTTILVK